MNIGQPTRHLTKKGLINCVRTTNVLRNINLSGDLQGRWDSSGVYLSNRNRSQTTDPFEYHLQCVANGASVDVHGGLWQRTADGTVYDAKLLVGSTPTADYSNVSSVEILPNAEQYVTLALSNGMYPANPYKVNLEPDRAIAAMEVNLPTELHKICLAKVLCNVEANTITSIEQYQVGDIQDFIEIVDNDSLGYDSDKLSEIYGWRAATNTAITDNDLLVFKQYGTNNASYVSQANLDVGHAANASSTPHADIADYATVSNLASFVTNIFLGHHGLTEWAFDDHNATPGSTFIFPYVSPRDTGDNRNGNRFEATVGLYDSSGYRSVMPTERQLCHSGYDDSEISVDYANFWLGYYADDHQYVTVDWQACQLQTDSAPDLDWTEHILEDDWSVTGHCNVGADCRVTDILHADKLQINDDEVNYWDDAHLAANVSGSVSLTSGTGALTLDADGAYLVGDLLLTVWDDTRVGAVTVTTAVESGYFISDSDGNMIPIDLHRGLVQVNP